MGRIAFVEILDRRGNLRERVRVEAFPATIGRGYSNAVIVDDRLAGVEHLKLSLDEEGGLVAEDLDTVNGTRLFKSRERIQRYRVPPGGEVVLRIGQTVLRLRGDDFAVGPPASSRALLGTLGKYIESGAVALLLFVAAFGANMAAYAQETTKKAIWSDLIGTSLGLLVVFALWTGFWSFLSRLVLHSFRFITHLAISSIASLVFLFFFIADEYFEFLFSAPAAAEAARFAGFAVIFCLLLYAHLSAMSELSDRRRILSSVLISAGIVGIALLVHTINYEEFSNELRFSSVMKPIGRTWVKAVPSHDFFGDLDKLKGKIDKMSLENRQVEMSP